MKEYRVIKTNDEKITFDSFDAFDAEAQSIDWSWGEPIPKTEIYMLYNSFGIGVKFVTDESPVTVNYFDKNGPVNRDSCVEFFLSPDAHDSSNYLNFEINAAKVMHLQHGDSITRTDIYEHDIFEIESRISNDGWQLKFFIPFEFIRRYFKAVTKEMRGNFYKCGDRTPSPHRAAWSPVMTPTSQFHRTDFFGRIILI